MKHHAVLILLSAPLLAVAAENEQDGFSGALQLGVSHYQLASNFLKAPNDGRPSAASLTQAPASQSGTAPLVEGEWSYGFAGTGTRLFISPSNTSTFAAGGGLQLGVRQQLPQVGAVSAALTYGESEVWLDPYALNVARQDGKLKNAGLALGWSNILNTPFSANFSYARQKLGNERSGQAQGLTLADQALLQRNGNNYGVQASYAWKLDSQGAHTLTPGMIYARADLDGKAMSTRRYGMQLAYAYQGADWDATVSLVALRTRYQAGNPVFAGQKADSRDALLSLGLTRKNLLGAKAWSAFLSGNYGRFNSDLAYFNAHIREVSIGLGYHF
ncbi:DUF2860 domain-containing protein [Chromobacterium sphagni]|uniref:DUF2860 domain-containing protein n=1 Tax=Chromobacterium sphagni TaxID=1903179 RepID=A0A1S1WZ94_9NEIS|nr:DUF2860 domain-containing protein [Chromobacterium sphagni]OHX12469.1 hypothetical protein BI347_02360 [Chromobacterium sphagni]OHX21446.1 hypothetical protein BI344_02645 [Chromobacterium sphagni]